MLTKTAGIITDGGSLQHIELYIAICKIYLADKVQLKLYHDTFLVKFHWILYYECSVHVKSKTYRTILFLITPEAYHCNSQVYH